MGTTSLKAFRDRFKLPLTDEQVDNLEYLKPTEGTPEHESIRARREAPAVTCRRAGAGPRRSRYRRCRSLMRCSRPRPRVANSPRPWRSCACSACCSKDKQLGQARGADCGRRVAYLRHGRPVPPDRHLVDGRPAVHAAGPRPAHVLQRRQERPDSARGHQRGRRHVLVDRGGYGILNARRADDPVLHLLFHVRRAAHRRPVVGGGRFARARLPCSVAPRDAPRSTARACNTKTATRTYRRRRFRTAFPTTRPSPTNWR